MSFTDELYRSRSRDETPGRSSRPRARGVEDVPVKAPEPEPEVVRDEPRENAAIRLSRAWKRVMLGEDGKLHADGALILRDMFKKSGFFSRVQYVAGNHDQTMVLAVRREFVIGLLAYLDLSEAAIEKQVSRVMNLRNEVFNDD